jgi:hypothetical protein
MKKLIFVAIAACGFLFVKAQPLAAPSSGTVHATLNIANVLELQFIDDGDLQEVSMSASFANEEDLEEGQYLTLPDDESNLPVLIASNRDYNVTVKATSSDNAHFNYTGSASGPDADIVMPISVISWNVNSSTTGGSAPGGWTALSGSPVSVITHGEEGSDEVRHFNIQFFANPGFNYSGGTYKCNIVLTATQF